MKRIVSLIIILILIMPAGATMGVAGEWEPDPVNIVVLDFSANNVPAASGEIARNSLEVLLYENRRIRILERSRYRDIIVKQNRGTFQCVDTGCAASIGRFLSADLVVMGSIDRMERFMINIKIVDAGTGSIVYACTETTALERDIPGIMGNVADKIGRYLRDPYGMLTFNWEKMNTLFAGVSTGYVQPLGTLHDRVLRGFSTTACLGVQYHNFMPSIETGCTALMDDGNRVYSTIIPVIAGLGYPLYLRRLSIIPMLGAGVSYNHIRGETGGVFELIGTAGLSAGIHFGRMQVYAGCSYTYILETGSPIEFLIIGAGIRCMM